MSERLSFVELQFYQSVWKLFILFGLSPSLAHGLQAPSIVTLALSVPTCGEDNIQHPPRSQLPLAFSVWTSMKSSGGPLGGLAISKEEGALLWPQVTHYSLQSL